MASSLALSQRESIPDLFFQRKFWIPMLSLLLMSLLWLAVTSHGRKAIEPERFYTIQMNHLDTAENLLKDFRLTSPIIREINHPEENAFLEKPIQIKVVSAEKYTKTIRVGTQSTTVIDLEKARDFFERDGLRFSTFPEVLRLLREQGLSIGNSVIAAGSTIPVTTNSGQQHMIAPVVTSNPGGHTAGIVGTGIMGLLNPSNAFIAVTKENIAVQQDK